MLQNQEAHVFCGRNKNVTSFKSLKAAIDTVQWIQFHVGISKNNSLSSIWVRKWRILFPFHLRYKICFLKQQKNDVYDIKK